MPIPKHILAVQRPKNTIVYAYGKNKDKFAVRQRIGCKNVDGRHIPVNGPTIGHIIDGQYVPIDLQPPISFASVDLKDWANVALCDQVFHDMLSELRQFYSRDDALRIYCIAILRVCEHGIKDHELKEAYENSFLSEWYPDVHLSKNNVCKFLNDLGKSCSRITAFMRARTAAVEIDHHLLVDGTLKSNESRINSFSDFSRKARVKGSRDISVLYAFDLEAMEPVCSKCYPGNMLDRTAYSDFIKENKIKKGIIVGDKGFPSDAAQEEFQNNPELHYLNPIKRNAKLIERHQMLEFNEVLKEYEGVTSRKEKCVGKDKWLYSYRDARQAAKEEQDWLERSKKNKSYSVEEWRKKQRTFGTIVLESDLDLDAETAYKAYESRWEIELVMRYYKMTCGFDETRVQDDYSVIGSEFCNFLATILTYRLIHAFDQGKLLEERTYKKNMQILKRAKKVKDKEWQLIKLNAAQMDALERLELIPKAEPMPRRKRGRPRKVTI